MLLDEGIPNPIAGSGEVEVIDLDVSDNMDWLEVESIRERVARMRAIAERYPTYARETLRERANELEGNLPSLDEIERLREKALQEKVKQ